MRRGYRQSVDHFCIFFTFDRTRRVNQPPARLQMSESTGQNRPLNGCEAWKILGSEPPLDLGIPSQRPGAGTRGVDQNPFKLPGERERLGGIERHAADFCWDIRQSV